MHFIADRRIALIIDQVMNLARVFLRVVELILVHQMKSQLVALCHRCTHHLESAEAIVVDLISRKLCEDDIVDLLCCVINLRKHALACKAFRDLQTKIIHDRRCQIDVGCRSAHNLALLSSADDQRNICNLTVDRGILLVQMVRTEHIAMIGGVDDERIRHLLIDDL